MTSSLLRIAKAAWWWWALHLVLALPLAAAFHRWLYTQTAYRPAADVLVSNLSLGTLFDVLSADHAAVLKVLWTAALTTSILSALAAGPLIGGSLAVLRRPAGPAVETFAHGAGAHAGPLLLIAVVSRGLALAGGLAAGVSTSAAIQWTGGETWEAGPFLGLAGGALAGVLVWLWLLAVGDTAAILRTRPGAPGAFRVLSAGVRTSLRHPLGLAGQWALRGVLPAALMQVGYVLVAGRVRALPLALLAVQQVVVFGQAACRVAVLDGERAYVDRWLARPSAREVDQIGPGQDGERQIEERQHGQGAVEPEQVQEHRAADGEQLGNREAGTDPRVPEREGDDWVAFGEAEGGDA